MASVGVKVFELTRGNEDDFGAVLPYPEADSTSFKKGDPVKLNSSGQVLLAVDTEAFFGIALEDSANDTNNVAVDILLVNTDQIWSGTISAAGATADTQQTDVGVECSYIKSTVTGETAKTVVDRSDVTTPSLVIVGIDPRDNDGAVGATDGRVLFQWLPGTVSTGGRRVVSI